MTAEVIAIRESTASASGWSPQEIAEVFRLGDMLQRHGLDLAISYGVSDEGDPWLVLSDPLDAEISFHIARIDQHYVVARGGNEEVVFKRHLREVAEVLAPTPGSENLVFGGPAEPLELYAVVALALAGSESFGQSPELKQVVESLVAGNREATGRDSQREADDRINDLARILIAAVNAGEADAGRAALAAMALPSALPAPLAAPVQPGAHAAPRFVLTASVDFGQALAPAQRDLASAQSMIAGRTGDGTGSTNWHQDAAPAAVPDHPLTLAQPESSVTATTPAGAVDLRISHGLELSVASRIELPAPILQANDIVVAGSDLGGTIGAASAGGSASAANMAQATAANLAQLLDFSANAGGVRVSLNDSAATILGSHGFDLITVGGHNLVQIGTGGAIVTITSGDNIIVGSSAVSTVNIAGGHNSVAGGSGAQTVNIATGSNTVTGGSGTQTVNIAGGTNVVFGGSGGTVVNVAGGSNSVASTSGNDTVNVADGQNTILAGSGSDSIHLRGGNNTVIGSTGSNVIGIEGGQATVFGGAGHDSVSLGGSASITGSSGINIIIGSAGGTVLNVGDAPSHAGIGVVGTDSALHTGVTAASPTSAA